MDPGATAADRQLLSTWLKSNEVKQYFESVYNGRHDAREYLQSCYDGFAELFYGVPDSDREYETWKSFVSRHFESLKSGFRKNRKRILVIFFFVISRFLSSFLRKPAIDLYSKNNGWTYYYFISEGLGWFGLGFQLTILFFPQYSKDWRKVLVYLFAFIALISECITFGYLGSVEPNRALHQTSLVFKCISEGGIHILNLGLLIQAMRKTPDTAGPKVSLAQWRQVPSDYRCWAHDKLQDHLIEYLALKARYRDRSSRVSSPIGPRAALFNRSTSQSKSRAGTPRSTE
ncbi:TPA_exp: hypothetical protein A8136_1711 [Trichophyton benhamiae CBS 112371]|nr:TPA_exp: hypothetical protein A8136_1711 [Trichophyton benhamiae CBS 112371]